jgi:hypothetical protein
MRRTAPHAIQATTRRRHAALKGTRHDTHEAIPRGARRCRSPRAHEGLQMLPSPQAPGGLHPVKVRAWWHLALMRRVHRRERWPGGEARAQRTARAAPGKKTPPRWRALRAFSISRVRCPEVLLYHMPPGRKGGTHEGFHKDQTAICTWAHPPSWRLSALRRGRVETCPSHCWPARRVPMTAQ